MRPSSIATLLFITLLLAGCSLTSPDFTEPIAVPASGTQSPAAEVKFLVSAPTGTPANADLTMVLLDPVTELDFNSRRIPLQPESDGHWSTTLTPTVGTLLYYRYEMSSPDGAIEVTTQGSPVDFRTVYISGPSEIHEMISRWSGDSYQADTGRILGQILSREDDQPLSEMVVSAAGQMTFTDGEGRFRLDGLPPGLHTVTAFSPTGSHNPSQQEALIASNASTPVLLELQPLEPVLVTFQVTVPADTPEEATLRLAGNLAQLGFRFGRSESGSYQSIARMPTLVRVDPEHFLGVFTLYAGSDLHYKYTLGDGVWNAERSVNGSFITRSVILEGESPTLRDTVEKWSDTNAEPTRFEVAIPEYTPSTDRVSIQFKANTWRKPLPMWERGSLWSYTLYGPESLIQDLEYRYCHNSQCDAATEIGFSGTDASGHALAESSQGTLIQDVVEGWQWLDRSVLTADSSTKSQNSEYLSYGGVELVKDFDPSWMNQYPNAFTVLGEAGVNSIILSPSWRWTQNNPFPVLEMDLSSAAMDRELAEIAHLAREGGMQVTLHPSFQTVEDQMDPWWNQAVRDALWWDIWFEEYRSLLLTYARWAERNSIDRFIIGGPEVLPALPFAEFSDGSPTGAPVDSDDRWRSLIDEVGEIYGGQLVFELEVKDGLSQAPPFLDLFDSIHLFWNSPLVEGEFNSPDVLLATIESQFNTVLDERPLRGKAISISLAYLSLEESASACPRQPDGSCRPLSDFSRGKVVDIDLEVDLQIQALIYEKFLEAAADEPQIEAVFAHGFYPAVILHDKSLSIYGKPAQDVLGSWFKGLTPSK